MLLEKQLRKNKKKFERNKFIEINTVKKHAVANAVQFVKNSRLDIEKALTKELQEVLKQQLKFKKETWDVIDKVENWRERMVTAETLLV